MNYDTFLKVLQSVITMTDAESPESVEEGKKVIRGIYQLILSSGMADIQTKHMAEAAARHFEGLIMCKDEFAGVPGQAHRNRIKRNRLAMTLYPHC